MKSISRFIFRYSIPVILFCVLLSIPSAYFTVKLYGNLKPDLEELLPRKSRSITDLAEIRSRLQSIDNLAVLVYSGDTIQSEKFVDDLAESLKKFEPETVSSVDYKIDRELKFFSDRKALFLEVEDLKRIETYIKTRINYEKSLYNPLNIFSGINIPEPKLDVQGLLKKYSGQADSFARFPGGYYATPDQKKRAMLIYMPGANSGIAGVYKLKAEVVKTIAALNPKSYAADLEIHYTGGVQNTLEEHSALIADIEKSANIVLVLVTLALIVFFRSFWATATLFTSLLMARFWTFAAAWFAIGYLNANSAFMGSIVLGSGITFGVILLSRYLEERRNGRRPVRAAWIAVQKCSRATLTAALAASVAYGSLFLTQFEGFKQYGIIGFMGMIFCWISSVVVFPALLVQVERFVPLIKKNKPARKPLIFGPLTRLLGRYPMAFLVGSIALSLVSLLSFLKFDPETIIETDLSHLRSKESMESGSGYWSKDQDDIFKRYLSPLAILAKSTEETFQIDLALKNLKKSQGSASLISSVSTINDFVPKNQMEKIKVLQTIKKTLPPFIFSRLGAEDREKAKSFLSPAAFKSFGLEDLPKLVQDKFQERDGSIGKLVLVEPPISSVNWSGADLAQFVEELRFTADQTRKQESGGTDFKPVPVAGALPVVSDMVSAISLDGPRATLFAFLGVVTLVLLLFRKPSISGLMLFALILGNLWLFGFILLGNIKINFLNFIALPITFGIGVDYGVNIFHRYLHEPSGDILKVVRETGAAVGLCSLTTMIGYSSLLIAKNQAFVSFGALAVFGELTSVVAAVITLPSYLLVRKQIKERKLLKLGTKSA